MLYLRLDVPIASFRMPSDRAYCRSFEVPPPSTVYGFLLSVLGESRLTYHYGVKVLAGTYNLNPPIFSQNAYKIERWKSLKSSPRQDGMSSTIREFEYLTNCDFLLAVDSSEDPNNLEGRIRQALADPASIRRYGALTLGTSTSIVNRVKEVDSTGEVRVFANSTTGRETVPIIPHYQWGGRGPNAVFARGEFSTVAEITPDMLFQIPTPNTHLLLNCVPNPVNMRGVDIQDRQFQETVTLKQQRHHYNFVFKKKKKEYLPTLTPLVWNRGWEILS